MEMNCCKMNERQREGDRERMGEREAERRCAWPCCACCPPLDGVIQVHNTATFVLHTMHQIDSLPTR